MKKVSISEADMMERVAKMFSVITEIWERDEMDYFKKKKLIVWDDRQKWLFLNCAVESFGKFFHMSEADIRVLMIKIAEGSFWNHPWAWEFVHGYSPEQYEANKLAEYEADPNMIKGDS